MLRAGEKGVVKMREGQGKAGQMVGGAAIGEPAEVQEDSDGGSERPQEKFQKGSTVDQHFEQKNGHTLSAQSLAGLCSALLPPSRCEESLPLSAGTRTSKGGA